MTAISPRRAETNPEVPGSPDGARHRRDRPQPRHAQRDRHLHGAGRAGDRPPPVDPDLRRISKTSSKAPTSPSMCSGATARSSPRGCSSITPRATDRHDSRPRVLGRPDALSADQDFPQRAVDVIEKYGPSASASQERATGPSDPIAVLRFAMQDAAPPSSGIAHRTGRLRQPHC